MGGAAGLFPDCQVVEAPERAGEFVEEGGDPGEVGMCLESGRFELMADIFYPPARAVPQPWVARREGCFCALACAPIAPTNTFDYGFGLAGFGSRGQRTPALLLLSEASGQPSAERSN